MFYKRSESLSHNLYLLSQLSVKLANSLKPGYFYFFGAIKLHGDLEVETEFSIFFILAPGGRTGQ